MIHNNCLGIIFANMHDEFLGEMTSRRTTGSVPFGGRYRLIDFALSNLVNSGISTVGVITKHNYASLMDHLGSGRSWDLARKRGGLVMLPPYGRPGTGVYNSRLEALSGAAGFLSTRSEEYVLMTDTNVVANMDFSDVLKYHKDSGADVTLVYKETKMPTESGRYRVLETKKDRVTDILINPKTSENVKLVLGVTVMSRKAVLELCDETNSRGLQDMVRDYFKKNMDSLKIMAYEFKGYAEFVTSQKSYYEANMNLLCDENRENLFIEGSPIYTKVRDDFPASYGIDSKVKNSIVADGCIIKGTVENSILFRGVTVKKGAVVRDCILMQGSEIGENCKIECAITDKNVVVSEYKAVSGTRDYPIYFAKGKKV